MKKILSFIFILFIALSLYVPNSISADEPAEDGTINLLDTFFITTTAQYKSLPVSLSFGKKAENTEKPLFRGFLFFLFCV